MSESPMLSLEMDALNVFATSNPMWLLPTCDDTGKERRYVPVSQCTVDDGQCSTNLCDNTGHGVSTLRAKYKALDAKGVRSTNTTRKTHGAQHSTDRQPNIEVDVGIRGHDVPRTRHFHVTVGA